jgi:hypothetical protein
MNNNTAMQSENAEKAATPEKPPKPPKPPKAGPIYTYKGYFPPILPDAYIGWAPIDSKSFSAKMFVKNLDEITNILSLWNWNAIEIFQGTRGDGSSNNALVITVFPCEKEKIPWIVRAVQPYGTLLEADVLVQTGTPSRQAEPLNNGGSISAALNSTRIGSVGGFLRIGDEIVGTTCHHVIFSGIDDPKAITDGYRPDNQMKVVPDNRGTTISSPSYGLYEKVAMNEVELAKKRKDEYKKYCIDGDLMPEDMDKHDMDIAHHEQVLELTRRRCWAGAVKYDCGEMHLTEWYGRRTTVDWTVFSIDPSRRITQPINTLYLTDITSYRENTCDIKTFHSFGDIATRGGMDVWKYGFRSKCTRGRTNGVWSRIYLGPVEQSPSASRAYTDEICIIADPGKKFSIDGDSGAWVVGANHELLGFLFAGVSDEPPYRSYMTDIHLLLTKIRAVSGVVPELPL